MNKLLLDSIYSTIYATVSATTKHVYFDFLPDQELLKQLTVVYELQNTSNEQTFDSKESNRLYELSVKINAPQLANLSSLSIYNLRESIYKLQVSHIRLIDEASFYDSDLKVWTNTTRFEVQSN